MPATPHREKHFTGGETVRDIVIGMADGLTVPFALAAGLSGATAATRVVVTAGLAEIVAGSIAMGLGGYLAAKTDQEHYDSERRRELWEMGAVPRQEEDEVAQVFRGYGVSEEHVGAIVKSISADRTRWVDFMMRFELGLETVDPKRARRSALTIAAAYIAGGLVPLAPYMASHSLRGALQFSVVLTLAALFIFGYTKGRFVGVRPVPAGLQTLFTGGLAAAAAFAVARWIS